jgi:hypothetical protein
MGRVNWLFSEPPHDPKLGAALRRLETESSPDEGEVLRQRITARARLRLAELRSPAPHWWEWISGWMPVAVPAGLAASLAAGLLVSGAGDVSSPAAYTSDAVPDSTLVIAAFSEGSVGQELAAHLVAPEGGEWLFEQAVTQ